MHRELRRLYLSIRKMFPMLRAADALKIAKGSLALVERLRK